MTENRPTVTTATIGSLIEAIRAGDPHARKKLVEVSYTRFVEIARRYLNSPDFRALRGKGVETAEVLNETLLNRVFKKNRDGQDLLDRQDFQSPTEFIGAVARHIEFCLKDLKRQHGKVRKKRLHQRTNAPSPADGLQPVDRAEQRPGQHDELQELADRTTALLEALEALEEQERQVIRLRYLMGMSREEVANCLDLSTKTITRLVRRAEEKLARHIALPPSG